MMRRACIIGVGAYGTALAEVFSEKADIALISRNSEVIKSINDQHINPRCLCNVTLNKNIVAYGDYSCCKNAEAVFIVTPVSAVRFVCEQIRGITEAPVILCSKGIEQGTYLLTSEITKEAAINNEICILSGPSFAHEIACGKSAAVSLSGANMCVLKALEEWLSSDTFKLVINGDIIGTQLCGAMKNVLAVLCGMYMGLGRGQSAIARLITEGLQELRHLIISAGGDPETAYDVCGIGDILLTCMNKESRNVRFGMSIAQGLPWTGDLAEGSLTAKILPDLQKRFKCDIPVLMTAYDAIYGKMDG